MLEGDARNRVVCFTTVLFVVTQRSSSSRGGELRDDTKNGCEADYEQGELKELFSLLIQFRFIDIWGY